MALLSKYLDLSIPHECFETVHSFEPDCTKAAFISLFRTFKKASQVYAFFYLVFKFKFSLKFILLLNF